MVRLSSWRDDLPPAGPDRAIVWSQVADKIVGHFEREEFAIVLEEESTAAVQLSCAYVKVITSKGLIGWTSRELLEVMC